MAALLGDLSRSGLARVANQGGRSVWRVVGGLVVSQLITLIPVVCPYLAQLVKTRQIVTVPSTRTADVRLS